jgi:hypothetical protein
MAKKKQNMTPMMAVAPVKEDYLESDEEMEIWFDEKIEKVKVEIKTKETKKGEKNSEEEEDTDVITEI